MWEILNLSPVTVEEKNMNKRVFLMLAAALVALMASVVYADKISDLQKKAESGDAEAQFELARAYAEGAGNRDLAEMGNDLALALDSVNQDYVKSAEWLQKAAEQGFDEAQYMLGCCYIAGLGVEKDYVKAMEWTRKAAEHGYAPAQNNLGCFYERGGYGVPQDMNKAFEWFLKAAEQGNPDSQFTVGRFYARGIGVEKNLIKAMEWYQKSADHGCARAVDLLQKFSAL